MLCLLIAFSCQKEEFPSAEEVFLYIHLPADNITKVGDPGVDHGEWSASIDSIAVFMVQNENVSLNKYAVTDLSTDNNGTYYIPLILGQSAIDIYAVAYKAPQTFGEKYNLTQLQNLKTIKLNDARFKDGEGTLESKRKECMMNLFSGSGTVESSSEESVTIYLTRLVSKVDVQWDVQDAYDSTTDKFVEVRMSEIEFSGLDFAYFFPDKKTETETDVKQTQITTGLYSCNSAISERNGRSYFYTFPEQTGVKSVFTFTLNYKKEGETDYTTRNYTATFKDNLLLLPAVWYKVNINVKGMSTDIREEIGITLGGSDAGSGG